MLAENGNRLVTESGVALAKDDGGRESWLPTLDNFKDTLKIPRSDDYEDSYLQSVLSQAIKLVAHECGVDKSSHRYFALVEALEYEYDQIKLDRSMITEIRSVQEWDDDNEEWVDVDYEVRWENELPFVLRTDQRFDACKKVRIEYDRGLTADADEIELFNAAVLATAADIYENPGRTTEKMAYRNKTFLMIKERLLDRRSIAKWTD